MNPTDVIVQKMTYKLRNAFLDVSRACTTGCICLKLFKHWSEPIVKIEVYHPYRKSVKIIVSILCRCCFYGYRLTIDIGKLLIM